MERDTANNLIRAIAEERDRQAFARLFSHYAPQVKGYLIRSGADPTAAEELTQEVMIVVWRRAATFDPARASAGTWIFTIARNRRIDRFRRERRPEVDLSDPLTATDESQSVEATARARQERIWEALSGLPPEQSSILERAYFQGLSLREIADQEGAALGTIKSRVRLAMGRLRKILDPDLL